MSDAKKQAEVAIQGLSNAITSQIRANGDEVNPSALLVQLNIVSVQFNALQRVMITRGITPDEINRALAKEADSYANFLRSQTSR